MLIQNKRPFYLYNPKLKERSRELRKNSTLAEILLWERLKGAQLLGYKFQRQKAFGEYIADFYCYKIKLVVEIDGLSHDYKMEYDRRRQKNLENLGLTLLRFSDEQVRKNIDDTIQAIVDWINISHTTV